MSTTNYHEIPANLERNDFHQPSPDEVTDASKMWAAASLDHLPTHTRLSGSVVMIDRAADGNLYRQAFTVTVVPDKMFLITLWRGASSKDLRHAQSIVREAKAGYFPEAFWDRCGDGWQMRRMFLWDEKPEGDELRPCAQAGCVERFHGWMRGMQDDPCRTEAIDHSDGYYSVRGWRYYGEEWTADVTNDEDCFPEGAAGLKVIRDLANDFAWAQGECDRLNKEVVRTDSPND